MAIIRHLPNWLAVPMVMIRNLCRWRHIRRMERRIAESRARQN